MCNKNVIIVGSNPSNKSPDKSAFHPSTRSRMILDEWFRDIECTMVFINIHNQKTDKNRQLTRNQIRNNLPRLYKKICEINSKHVVALGNTAKWALDQLNINHMHMPHPSGLNRQLNDKEYVAKKILELKNYVQKR